MARAAIAAEVDGELRDLHAPLVAKPQAVSAPSTVAASEPSAQHPEQVLPVANPLGLQEVGVDPSRARPARSELEMLQIQVAAFEEVIRRLQGELQARQAAQADTNKLVAELREEIAQLRRQMDRAP